ncbi:tyrosine-type recombinase/integrase [Geminocystis sp. NIES-3708]|uniref:tyrosine-type recombinase/integrase n=1 Tax=Geminocystis sp. NIES-3708 TaxID=1615909 RepID=UPI000833C4CE|nr:tyrosine-type recombinase/integrase [Geminocystis sp. NIES-3708]
MLTIQSQYNITNAKNDTEVMALWFDGKTKTTIKTYGYSLKQFFNFAGCPLTEIRLDTLIQFKQHLMTLNYAVSSINNKLMAIKSLLSFAYKIGYIPFNVGTVVKSVKNHENITDKILMSEEIKALIDNAKNSRDGLLIKLLANTGLRISEAINLRWNDIKLNKIAVFGKGGKTRYVSIKDELLNELFTLKNRFCEYIFYSNRLTPLKRENVHTMLKEVAKKANLTDRVSAHWLRHSTASHALNNGASLNQVKELLGHGSINTTARYLHTLNGTTATDFIDF